MVGARKWLEYLLSVRLPRILCSALAHPPLRTQLCAKAGQFRTRACKCQYYTSRCARFPRDWGASRLDRTFRSVDLEKEALRVLRASVVCSLPSQHRRIGTTETRSARRNREDVAAGEMSIRSPQVPNAKNACRSASMGSCAAADTYFRYISGSPANSIYSRGYDHCDKKWGSCPSRFSLHLTTY
jgi:hypothetical protein